jgi:Domain of unknown function DUF11
MKRSAALALAVAAAAWLGAAAAPPSLGPEGASKRCAGGFAHVVVRGRHVCRPAADLRVTVESSPDANRVGGTFTYVITVANAGRRRATAVVLTAAAAADKLSVSPADSCDAEGGSLRAACRLGTMPPGARTTATLAVRATTVGPLRLSVRVSSPSRDVRLKDNSATRTTRVTDPDFVRGRGSRPTAGGGPRPPVTIEVDAISGPRGDDATGTFWTKYPTLELRGRVVCLMVNGNRASVGGIVEQTNFPNDNPVGSTVHFGFTDNGEPGSGRDTEVTYLKMQDATICPVPLQEIPEILLIEGNFTVHDEQVPTARGRLIH